MNIEFNNYYKLLTSSKNAEDVFGEIKTSEELHSVFTQITKVIHPDRWFNDKTNLPKANEIFKILNEFNRLAEERLKAGDYGNKNKIKEISILTHTNQYILDQLIAEGDLSYVYRGKAKNGKLMAVKIVKDPRNNDLITNEIETIKYLHDTAITKDLPVMEHVSPRFIDSFEINDSGEIKKGIVYPFIKDLVTIEKILEVYPNGIDVRDAAWMINRILAGLSVSSQAEVVHGAIVPNNILLDLPTHNGILIGWGFSVKCGNKLKAISSQYKNHYPQEVFDKKTVDSGLDMYMLAKLFITLVGGNVETNEIPKSTPKAIAGLFRACLLGPKQRTIDPHEFFNEFNDVLTTLYGPKKFREFKLVK